MHLWIMVPAAVLLVAALVTCVLLVVRDHRNRAVGGEHSSDDGDMSNPEAIARTMTVGVSQHHNVGSGGI